MTEEQRKRIRNRGLRAAAPTTSAPTPPPSHPNGEVAAAIAAIEEENQRAGLSKAVGAVVTESQTPLGPLQTVPAKTVKLIEIEHDYEASGPGTFTSLSGVVLRVKPFSNELVIRTQQRMLPDRPKPPSKWSEADHKNYVDDNDPDYREAMGAYLTRASEVGFDLRVSHGTELVSVPDGIHPVESDEWINEITNPDLVGEYGIPIRRTGVGRYLDWLQYYALGEGDIRHLYQMLDHASGIVREVAVVEQVKSFRGVD